MLENEEDLTIEDAEDFVVEVNELESCDREELGLVS